MSALENERQQRESVERLAGLAAEKAVTSVFERLGIDVSDPIAAQAQFAALRKLAHMMEDKDLTEDLAWVRRLRLATEAAKDVSVRTVVKIVVGAIVGLVLLGTKDWWLSHISIK